ncbi:MAG: endonuclease [Saprospiraceae bacterium]|jgi:endonuclease I|nr:endonuclease [Saprospiraceae bacterium]
MKVFIFSLALLISQIIFGQEIIFPGLKSDSLKNDLVAFYTPSKILTYDQARTKLYNEVFLFSDSLECFYSGYKIPVDKQVNILSWTAKYGIQTEHLYPRSKGADKHPAIGDLHHLVPIKGSINTLRKNTPYKDIDDTKTKYLLLGDKVFTVPDRSKIDAYSESAPGVFEPRESIKGDVARSVFYFYMIYQKQADKSDNRFFPSMLADLCRWHRIDKVDSFEWKKTMAIGRIQGNVNPFVIDATLAERCYCSGVISELTKTYNTELYPNPTKGLFYISIPEYSGQVIMSIRSESGKLISTHYLMYSGLLTWRLTDGIYDIELKLESGQVIGKRVLVK